MSTANEDLLQILQPQETYATLSRQSKNSYTREFLLSLSDLEICKRLPKGFDESLISEFRSSSLQSFRRNDYSSSPRGKGETGNFVRGLERWDNRSSGRSDTDSQSDRDSDSGRRYGNQSRRSWQNPEHDGLLGSGSFPRPPGFRPDASVPNSRTNDQPPLKKSSDAYHPPRLVKAAPHSRRETKDSLNDETFGWGESTNEDRVEEERKRRVDFEMMRKEQHKELQEKMKLKTGDKLKNDPMTELASSSDSGRDAVITNGLDPSLMKSLHQNDSSKSSISSQGHQNRPLVPPGFANAAVEKTSGPTPLEVGKLELGHGNKDEKPDNNFETTSPFASKGGTRGRLSLPVELSSKTTDSEDQSFSTQYISEISEIVNMGVDSENLNGLKTMGETARSTSILEKFFGGSLSINSSSPSDIIEDPNVKTDDAWSPKDSHVQTSKFVHLFLEEEKKTPKGGILEKSNDLLSFIGGEKSGLLASETKAAQKCLPPQSNLVKLSNSTSNDFGISEVQKPETGSTFLTCEDLEQAILSNVGESSRSAQPPGIRIGHGLDNENRKADIDKNASQHLLSLLQMGASVNSNNMPLFATEPKILGSDGISSVQCSVRDEDAGNLDCGKGLTLETLFGSAFMKELKSSNTPVSVQRNSAVSSFVDVSEPSIPPLVVSDDGAVTSSVDDARFKTVYKEDYISRLGGGYDEKVGVNWLNLSASQQTKTESPNLASFSMRLPEKDNLTSLGSMYTNDLGVANAEVFSSSSNPQANIAGKLAALGGSMRDERPSHREDNPAFRHAMMPPHSSPQFYSAPMNHGRPMFDPHSAPIDPQFNFLPRQEAPVHHQFNSANLGHAPYRHPSSGLPEFDHPIHPMLQQLHMPNNNNNNNNNNNIRPSSHLLPGFPGGNLPGYMQEHNILMQHSFPLDQQQPNLGGHGMRLGPAHGDINNQAPPQTFQSLLAVEPRWSQKPNHPAEPRWT